MASTVKERSTPEREHQLMVALRIRPLLGNELNRVTRVAYKIDDKLVVLVDPHGGDVSDPLRAKRITDRRYNFDCVFDCTTSQEEVYGQTTKHLVDDVMQGFNGTVFAYGATGSGKTYTMSGTSEDPGIMARALNDLFSAVRSQNNNAIYKVSLAYAEIYNENIRDLLNPASGYLELREDSHGNHQVVGLSEVTIQSADEVMRLLMKGNRQRTQESTSANRTSSRSHAMLQVLVRQESEGESATQEVKTGRLYMVDLAGSERASRTRNTGKRLMEGAHINKSLLALGNCINALAEPSSRYVNFRDSKLTRLLKEALSGNCRTVMVAHIGPSAWNYEESRKTLLYASRAKNITNKVRSNVSDVTHHVAQYHVIIRELRQEIQKLHDKLGTQDREITSCSPESRAVTGERILGSRRLGGAEMKRLKTELIACFNHQMELRRKLMSTENTLMAIDAQFEKFGFMVSEWETEIAKSSEAADDYPEYIQSAWGDVRQLEDEEKNYLELRDDIQRKLENCRQKTHTLMESLPEKASSLEQRELLTLLARVHQLEIENMEMQASQLIRDQELRQKELMILRYDRQRQLCDQIITKQRALLDDISSGKTQSNESSKELMDLYHLYQQELQELLDGRESVVNSSLRHRLPLGTRPLGTSESMLDLSHDHSPLSNANLADRLFIRRTSSKRVSDESLSEPSTPAERTRTWRLPSLESEEKHLTSRFIGLTSRGPTWISLKHGKLKNENMTRHPPQHLPSLDLSRSHMHITPNDSGTSLSRDNHKKRLEPVQVRNHSIKKTVPKTKRTPPPERLKPLEQLTGFSLSR